MYLSYYKRWIDVFFSIIGIAISMIPFFVIALIHLLVYRSSPFYIQSRPGFKGELFNIIKFKTMRSESKILLNERERVTSLGQFLRSSSLDELPQLFNVLKGDMSMVGPRPLLAEYLSKYNTEQNQRHLLRPGLTGWAQVNGRNLISWEEKFKLDVWYVKNVSFGLDFEILLKTIRVVFLNDDSNHIEKWNPEENTLIK